MESMKMIRQNKIAVCGSRINNICTNISSMGYSCVRTAPDSLSVVKSVLTDSPAAIIADLESIPAASLAKSLDMLGDSGIRPLCIAIGNDNGILSAFPYTYCCQRLPDEVRLSRLISSTRNESENAITAAASAYDTMRAAELENTVTEIIRKIGIPANIKGYRYLRNAVMLAAEDMSILDSVTKRLYPEIAKSNNTTPSRVERAIRHAISSAWARGDGDPDFIEKKLRCRINFAGERPTNSELIALISDSIRLTANA